MTKNFILMAVLTLFMLGAFVYGIFKSGSPLETRGRKLDEQRVSDISSLSYSIEDYFRQNNKLPQYLTELSKNNTNINGVNDPESGKTYDYQLLNETNYSLCANFSTDSSKSNNPNQASSSLYSYNSKFQHPKGYHCFNLNTLGVISNALPITPVATRNNQSGMFGVTENVKQGYDAVRLSDLLSLQNAINVLVQESTISAVLCANGNLSCSGKSLSDGRVADGTGWIKANLAKQRSVSIPTLPLDPINDGLYHYVYCSMDGQWEINAKLQSAQQVSKMSNDGGDDDELYEVGSNLTVIGNSGNCRY